MTLHQSVGLALSANGFPSHKIAALRRAHRAAADLRQREFVFEGEAYFTEYAGTLLEFLGGTA